MFYLCYDALAWVSVAQGRSTTSLPPQSSSLATDPQGIDELLIEARAGTQWHLAANVDIKDPVPNDGSLLV
jgi:hypothetical protein